MDKKIGFLIVALFAILVAFSGCSSKPKETQTATQTAFVGGSQGLAISLLPGQPPAQIFSGQEFTIAIQVDNKGEGTTSVSPVNQSGTLVSTYGVISLAGIDYTRFGIANTTQYITAALEPVKKIGTSTVPGGQTQVILTGASASFPLQVSILYTYASKSAASVCLSENIYQQTTAGPSVCKVAGSKTVSAQGAPVKVSTVDENPAGTNKVGFSIKVKNFGKGTPFYNAVSIPTTTSGIGYSDLNKVKINSVKVGDKDITCTPAVGNTVLLVNNEGTLYCTMDTTGKGTIVDLLTVELGYSYSESTSSTITVTGTGA
jgi:hypothetical protein